MTAHNIDGSGDLVVAISRPRLRTIGRIVVFGLGAMFSFAIGAFLLRELLTHETVTGYRRGLLIALAGFSFLAALFKLLMLVVALKRPFAVLESGIELQGWKIPWEEVVRCRWGRYTPGILNLRTHHGRIFIPISSSQRAGVESALRHSGKRQDVSGQDNRFRSRKAQLD
jgi:hypothetical protein